MQEGIYLYNHDIDPYSGGIVRHVSSYIVWYKSLLTIEQSPLYLALFSTIIPTSAWAAHIIWTLNDAIGAWALVSIWRSRQGAKHSHRDTLVGLAYLLNPYVFLPSLALSTSAIECTLILLAVAFAAQGMCVAVLQFRHTVNHKQAEHHLRSLRWRLKCIYVHRALSSSRLFFFC